MGLANELDPDRRRALDVLLRILRGAVASNASDIHLKAGSVPRVRVRGRILPLEHPPLEEGLLRAGLMALVDLSRTDTSRMQRKQFDFSFDLPDAGRFRSHLYQQSGTLAAAIRHVRRSIPDFAQLRLPPVIKRIAQAERGLVLVCGATCNGKSTTIASMLEFMNQSLPRHVVTVEEPIEYTFEDKHSCFVQREVGRDVDSWGQALEGSLREDPDVLFVGETRALEEMEVVLNAAESGRLVITTLHSVSAERAVSRMINLYASEFQVAARNRIADTLLAIVAQKLVPKKAKNELILVTEVLTRSPTVMECIRDPARQRGLTAAIEKGRHEYGSHSFDQVFLDLVRENVVSVETAKAHVHSASDFVRGLSLTA